MTNLDRKMEHGTDRMHALFAFEDSVILATNIERLMAEQNYDKKKFAEVAGITRPTLLKLLRGELIDTEIADADWGDAEPAEAAHPT